MCDFSAYGVPSDEWLAYEASNPFPKLDKPIQELKPTVNAAREKASANDMESLSFAIRMRDHFIPARDGFTLEARSYRPANNPDTQRLPIVIYFHGGGFLFGTLSSEDAICSRIAVYTDVVVVNVNYRHTPEWTFPTAWHDSQDAFAWIHTHLDEISGDREKVIVAGNSAGAQLTASLVLEKHLGKVLAEYPAIQGQYLMIPPVNHPDYYESVMQRLESSSVCSYVQCAEAPILSVEAIGMFTGLLKIPPVDVKDTRISMGNAEPDEVKGLPPTIFAVAGMDPLRDEGLLFAKMLSENGVPTNVHVFKGMPHGFNGIGGEKLPVCKIWDELRYAGIKWALSQPKATNRFEVHEH